MKTYKTIFLFAAITGLFFLNSCKSDRGIEDQKTITSIPLVEPGDRLTLPTADGSTVTVTVLDGDNDGKADGIDFAGDGLADFSLIDLENPAFFGIDLSGDAQTDYYLGKDENGEFQIFLSADSSGGNGVTIILGPSGDFIGLDTDGNGFANIDFSGNVLYPPAAVRNPNTAVNFTYLTITWDKVAGTDSYNLYWSTTSGIGISGTLISHVRSPYIHRDLANGTKYFYVITAVNAAGESASSVEFSGTPLGAPGKVGRLNVRDFIPEEVDPAIQDCTTYIQAALDTGEDVYFPPGSYRTTTPLRLKTNGQTIFGEGRIVTTGTRCLLTDRSLYDVTIRGLTMQNLGEAEGGRDSALGIYSEPSGSAGFERSDFLGLTLVGFGIGFSVSGVPGAPVPGTKDSNRITDCIIRDTLAKIRIGSGGGSGIYVRGGYFRVTGNLIENMQGGVLWSTDGVIADNRIINAWDDNGIYVAGSVNVSVTGNYIENTKADGIALNSTQNIAVMGNKIINAGNGCIRVQASEQITISGNTCRAEDSSNYFIRGYASAKYPGSRDVTIENNIFQGPTSQSSNPIIFVSGTLPHRNIIITDNIFYGLDTSSLVGLFFGPYAIINIREALDGSAPAGCSVSGNFFSNIQKISGYDESVFIRGATATSNTFRYK